jgi:hypothetical protein
MPEQIATKAVQVCVKRVGDNKSLAAKSAGR